MGFQRQRDAQETLGVGLANQIPVYIADYDNEIWDYKNWWNVIDWSYNEDVILRSKYNAACFPVFKYMMGLNGKQWHGQTVDIKENKHDILWDLVCKGLDRYIEEFFKIPNMFVWQELKLDIRFFVDEADKQRQKEERPFTRPSQFKYMTLGHYYAQARELKYDKISQLIKDYYEINRKGIKVS